MQPIQRQITTLAEFNQSLKECQSPAQLLDLFKSIVQNDRRVLRQLVKSLRTSVSHDRCKSLIYQFNKDQSLSGIQANSITHICIDILKKINSKNHSKYSCIQTLADEASFARFLPLNDDNFAEALTFTITSGCNGWSDCWEYFKKETGVSYESLGNFAGVGCVITEQYNPQRFKVLFDKLKQTEIKSIEVKPQIPSKDFLLFCSLYGTHIETLYFDKNNEPLLKSNEFKEIIASCPSLKRICLLQLPMLTPYYHLLELNCQIVIDSSDFSYDSVRESDYADFLKEAFARGKFIQIFTKSNKVFSKITFESIKDQYKQYFYYCLSNVINTSQYYWDDNQLTRFPHLADNELTATLFIDAWFEFLFSHSVMNPQKYIIPCLKYNANQSNFIIAALRTKVQKSLLALNELASSNDEKCFLKLFDMALFLKTCVAELKELENEINELLKKCSEYINNVTGYEIDDTFLAQNFEYCSIKRFSGLPPRMEIQLNSLPSKLLTLVFKHLHKNSRQRALQFKSSAQGAELVEIFKEVHPFVEGITLTDHNQLSVGQFKTVLTMCQNARTLNVANLTLTLEHYLAIPKQISGVHVSTDANNQILITALKDHIKRKKVLKTDLRAKIHLLNREFINQYLEKTLEYYDLYSQENHIDYPTNLANIDNVFSVLKQAISSYAVTRTCLLLSTCHSILAAHLPNEKLEYLLLNELHSQELSLREDSQQAYNHLQKIVELISPAVIRKNFKIYLEIIDRYKLELPQHVFNLDNVWIGYEVALERKNNYFLYHCAQFLTDNKIAELAVIDGCLHVNHVYPPHSDAVLRIIQSIKPHVKNATVFLKKLDFEVAHRIIQETCSITTKLTLASCAYTDEQFRQVTEPCQQLCELTLHELTRLTASGLICLGQNKVLKILKIIQCPNVTRIPSFGNELDELFISFADFKLSLVALDAFKKLTLIKMVVTDLSFLEGFSNDQELHLIQSELSKEAAAQSLLLAMSGIQIRVRQTSLKEDIKLLLDSVEKEYLQLNIHKLFGYISSFEDDLTFGRYLEYYTQHFWEKYVHTYHGDEEFRKTILRVFPPRGETNLFLHPVIASISHDDNLVVSTVTQKPLYHPHHILRALSEFEDLSNMIIHLVDSIAVDATGPRRQFLMNLFEGLCSVEHIHYRFVKLENENRFIPELTVKVINVNLRAFVIIGRILAYCLKENGAYPIGDVFCSGFYRVLTSLKANELEQPLSLLRNLELYDLLLGETTYQFKMFKSFIQLEPESSLSNEQTEFLEILEIKHEGKMNQAVADDLIQLFGAEMHKRIIPIQAIALGMKIDLTGKDPKQLEEKIQGVLTKDAFLAKIEVNDPMLHEWLVEWVQQHSLDEIRNVLIAITAGPSLSMPMKFKRENCDGMFAQTCFGIVLVSKELTKDGFMLEMNEWAVGKGNTKFHRA